MSQLPPSSLPPEQPLLPHEKILRLLITNAQAVLSTHDEPMAVLLAIAWNPQLGELPFGTLVTKKGGSTDMLVLSKCLEQSAKMAKYVTEQIGSQADQLRPMVMAQTHADMLKKAIEQKDKTIHDQALKIRQLQAEGHHEEEANGSTDVSSANQGPRRTTY